MLVETVYISIIIIIYMNSAQYLKRSNIYEYEHNYNDKYLALSRFIPNIFDRQRIEISLCCRAWAVRIILTVDRISSGSTIVWGYKCDSQASAYKFYGFYATFAILPL